MTFITRDLYVALVAYYTSKERITICSVAFEDLSYVEKMLSRHRRRSAFEIFQPTTAEPRQNPDQLER